MILSCAEVHFDNPHPSFRQWIVGVTPSEGLASILEKCGKIPKKPGDENDQHPEWKCYELEGAPIDGSDGGTWRISAKFRQEIIVAETSDEPHFPPYTGPKGKQPDGSFVLTPRCLHELSEMFLHKWNRIDLPDYHKKYIDRLGDVIYEETGHSFPELT